MLIFQKGSVGCFSIMMPSKHFLAYVCTRKQERKLEVTKLKLYFIPLCLHHPRSFACQPYPSLTTGLLETLPPHS